MSQVCAAQLEGFTTEGTETHREEQKEEPFAKLSPDTTGLNDNYSH
jgi:hypothetical protein